MQSNTVGASTSEGSNACSPLWKSIWRAKIPHKVKIFTRKLSHDVMSTKFNLARKRVHLEIKCGACSEYLKMNGHVFKECVCEGCVVGVSIGGWYITGTNNVDARVAYFNS